MNLKQVLILNLT